jgi:hypothetical protein
MEGKTLNAKGAKEEDAGGREEEAPFALLASSPLRPLRLILFFS